MKKSILGVYIAFAIFGNLATANGQSNSYANCIDQAEAALSAGLYPDCLAKAKQAMTLKPAGWEAQRYAAKATFYLDRPDEARAFLTKAIAKAPKDKQTALRFGFKDIATLELLLPKISAARKLAKGDQHRESAAIFVSCVEILPDRLDWSISAAYEYMAAEAFDDARATLQNVVARNDGPVGNKAQRMMTSLATAEADSKKKKQALEQQQQQEAAAKTAAENQRLDDARRAAADAQRAQDAVTQKSQKKKDIADEIAALKVKRDAQAAVVSGLESEMSSADMEVESKSSRIRSAERSVKDGERYVENAEERLQQAEENLRQTTSGAARAIATYAYNQAKSSVDSWKQKLEQRQEKLEEAKAAKEESTKARQVVKDRLDQAKRSLNTIDQRIESANDRLRQIGG